MYLQQLAFDRCILHLIKNEAPFAIEDIHVGSVILYCDNPDVIRQYPVNLSNGANEVYRSDLLFLPPVKIELQNFLIRTEAPVLLDGSPVPYLRFKSRTGTCDRFFGRVISLGNLEPDTSLDVCNEFLFGRRGEGDRCPECPALPVRPVRWT